MDFRVKLTARALQVSDLAVELAALHLGRALSPEESHQVREAIVEKVVHLAFAEATHQARRLEVLEKASRVERA